MKKKMAYIMFFSLLVMGLVSCKTTQQGPGDPGEDSTFAEENEAFLKGEEVEKEIFRVLISSDRYDVVQLKYGKYIQRKSDPGGDQFIKDEIKKLNKIEEAREGVIAIWLYPDSGNIMKIRPQKLTYLVEVDKIISDDIQRWSFAFPKKVVTPTKFEIRYRIVLRKKMSDEDIMEEVRKKMLEEQ